ncbi:histidine phosphatase family protein [Candidatus Saccharibacteria bacterium]|nr:histidine phosphatase family protein [Candidatus Saccharibacteria bacterium]
MKILFVRHSESTDDIDNQYGGWADFELTENGRMKLAATVDNIQKLNINFEKILHSPLKRAFQSAEILSAGLHLQIEELIWLKERNKYGLLSGQKKEFAKAKLPELLAMLESGYVYGAEPEEKFHARVSMAYEILKELKAQLICVTHGGFLNSLVDNHLHAEYLEAGDGGYILVDTAKDEILSSFNFKLK